MKRTLRYGVAILAMVIYGFSSTFAQDLWKSDGNDGLRQHKLGINDNSDHHSLQFYTFGEHFMSLSSSGYLGIGKDYHYPEEMLSLRVPESSTFNPVMKFKIFSTTIAEDNSHILTCVSPFVNNNYTNITDLRQYDMIISAGDVDATNTNGGGNLILTTRKAKSRIRFATTPIGTVNDVERMTILDNGNVGIGTMAPTCSLDVSGDLRIRDLPTSITPNNYDMMVVDDNGVVYQQEIPNSYEYLKIGGNDFDGILQFGNLDLLSGISILSGGQERLLIEPDGIVRVLSDLTVGDELQVTGEATFSQNVIFDKFAGEYLENTLVAMDTDGKIMPLPYGTFWKTAGNTLTGNEFIGSVNAVPVRIKTDNTERVTIDEDGNVGINTPDPESTLHIVDGAIVSEGAVGGVHSSSYTTRMQWIPEKAAFRVGYNNYPVVVSESPYIVDTLRYWNEMDSVGLCSVAMGGGAIATGDFSFAHGGRSIGDASVSFGGTAYGYYSFSRGGAAYGDFSIQLGFGRTYGQQSISLGGILEAVTIGEGSFAIGNVVTASGDKSMALGNSVSTGYHDGSIAIGDIDDVEVPEYQDSCTTDNQLFMRFRGVYDPLNQDHLHAAYRFYTNDQLTAGVYMLPNQSGWINISDRNRKENFEDVDGEKILESISKMEVSTWSYKETPSEIRYMGPMAQDFYEEFKLGGQYCGGINQINIAGVNMAAIKALIARTDKLEAKTIDNEEASNLKKENTELKLRVDLLEEKLNRLIENQGVVNDCYADITLDQNMPNPFNGITNIHCFVPARYGNEITLVVADASGNSILQQHTVVSGQDNDITIDASNLNSGIYVYGIAQNGAIIKSNKMIVVK